MSLELHDYGQRAVKLAPGPFKVSTPGKFTVKNEKGEYRKKPFDTADVLHLVDSYVGKTGKLIMIFSNVVHPHVEFVETECGMHIVGWGRFIERVIAHTNDAQTIIEAESARDRAANYGDNPIFGSW